MSTRHHHSEDKLAELACAPLRDRAGARVLIGGLGFGFTLKAALRLLPADAHVVVAELVRAVIDWNENPDYALASDALRDPRVELRHADVVQVLRDGAGEYDAIMLDVDNGPDPLTTTGNSGLYDDGGIRAAITALRPGGRLAYWSATPEPGFERALRRCGLEVETVKASTWERSRSKHAILLAWDPR
jgi:spermidine synthase